MFKKAIKLLLTLADYRLLIFLAANKWLKLIGETFFFGGQVLLSSLWALEKSEWSTNIIFSMDEENCPKNHFFRHSLSFSVTFTNRLLLKRSVRFDGMFAAMGMGLPRCENFLGDYRRCLASNLPEIIHFLPEICGFFTYLETFTVLLDWDLLFVGHS